MLAAACAGALALACVLSPAAATSGPVVCPFRLLTGLPCPGCGMTRAWVFLAHGDVGAAASANPFVLVTMPAAGALVVATCVAWRLHRRPPDVAAIARHRLTKVVVACWLAFALLRLVAVASGLATV